MTASKIVTEIKRDHWFEMCEKNDAKWHMGEIQIKYKIIAIIKSTISEDVALVVQPHENYHKFNINHSPSIFSL